MAPHTGPHTTESVLHAFPALHPWMAALVAHNANRRGKGVPRASTPDPRPTPQLVVLSPRHGISNHRRKIAAWLAGSSPGVERLRPELPVAPVGVQRNGRA